MQPALAGLGRGTGHEAIEIFIVFRPVDAESEHEAQFQTGRVLDLLAEIGKVVFEGRVGLKVDGRHVDCQPALDNALFQPIQVVRRSGR